MTQKSYPWPGVAAASGVDAGRYTAPEWWGEWATEQLSSGVIVTTPLLRPLAAWNNIGVYYGVDNKLAVTSPANNQITIATGAWQNDGQFGYNDTKLSAIAVTSPAANPRIDRVVIRKNYTSNTYTPTNAAALTVPPYTARITVVSGAEAVGPVAPTLIQDTARNPAGAFGTDGTWDIPLAQYEISVGGVISGLTDEREWVDAETKTLWIPPNGGYNDTDNTDIERGSTGQVAVGTDGGGEWGYFLIVTKAGRVWGDFIIPEDFLDDMTIMPVLRFQTGAGAYEFIHTADYGSCGQAAATHTDSIDDAENPGTNYLNQCWASNQLTLTSPATGDIVTLTYQRDNTGDAFNADFAVVGWVVEYLGWRR